MTTPPEKQFLGYLHSFRGFAILNIVIIHAFVAASIGANKLDFSNWLLLTNEVLFHDSTLYFAVISGILFSAVLRPRGYVKFFKSKAVNVVLPYLVLTIILTLFSFNWGAAEGVFASIAAFFQKVVIDFIYGKAQPVYWYLPVLFFLFLITPLVDYLIHHQRVGRIFLIIILLAPLAISRVQMAFDYILSWQTMVYFTGGYAFGMFLGTDINKKMDWLNKNFLLLLIIGLVSSACLFYFYINEIDKMGIVSLKETAFYVQKLALTCLFILVFKKVEEKEIKWLNRLAEDSFSIYFLHAIFLFGFIPLYKPLLELNGIYPFNVIIGGLVMTAISISISMLIVWIFRKSFGKKSRMIVGS